MGTQTVWRRERMSSQTVWRRPANASAAVRRARSPVRDKRTRVQRGTRANEFSNGMEALAPLFA